MKMKLSNRRGLFMAKKMSWVSTVLMAGLIFGAVAQAASEKTITVAGSTAFQPFAEKLAQKFMEEKPEARVNVQGGGSIVGLQAIRAGAVQIAMADLVNLPEDIVDPNGSFTNQVVAKDGIAICVHPSNPVANLSLEQVKKIFTGEIKNWKEVGGKDASIDVVSREKGSGTGKSFEDLVLKGAKLTPDALFQESNGTVRESISVIPNAIGYIFLGLVNEKVKPVTLDNQAASKQNILDKKYPLVNQIYLVSKKDEAGLGKEFLDFVLSSKGQKIIEDAGLIPAKK